MQKSGFLNSFEDFLPERAEVGGDRPESVLGGHFVNDLLAGPRLVIQIFLGLLLDLRVHWPPERSRFLALKSDYEIIDFPSLKSALAAHYANVRPHPYE